ncbi:hypothetical protein Taro_024779 [Colocasia esculenta]|uniref:Uncharacterized protein n=1 Tax=Colocasia esculenta TaxID=4460 RepID=A0A843V769_COLES|nr:hypothetical protein [Colocasia esculenta]
MCATCRMLERPADVLIGKATVGRTELSQALLIRERSCRRFFGRFGVPVRCSTRSRREDVAWSGGDVVP